MAELFANGARGRIANVGGISAGSLSLTLRAGQGASFPAYGVGDYSWLTLEQGTAEAPTKREIVQVTARAGEVLTIVRAQQGTTALAFDAGARVEMRLTALTLSSFRDLLGFSRKFVTGGLVPENSNDLTGYGAVSSTIVSSGTQPTPTLTTLATSMPRVRYDGGTAQIYGNTTIPLRAIIGSVGTAPNLGGVEYTLLFAIEHDILGTRRFLGLTNVVVGDRLAALNPSARTADAAIGIGQEDTTAVGANWQLYHSAGAGTVTQVDTGIAKVINNLMFLRIWSPRGVPRWNLELIDFTAGSRYFNSFTSNISTGTQGMTQSLLVRRTAAGTDSFSVYRAAVYQW